MENKSDISKHDAYVIVRVMLRIEQQIEQAIREHREADWRAMARLSGALTYKQFGGDCVGEL